MPAPAAPNYTTPDIELDPFDTVESAVAAPLEPLSFPDTTPLLPAPEYEVRAHVRRRRVHQPLRILPLTMLMGLVLVCQVVAFLWIQGMSMKARNTSNQLDREIGTTRLKIERTRNSIAARNSIGERLADGSQIDGGATQDGWHVAQQSEFDDVRSRTPYQPPQPAQKANR